MSKDWLEECISKEFAKQSNNKHNKDGNITFVSTIDFAKAIREELIKRLPKEEECDDCGMIQEPCACYSDVFNGLLAEVKEIINGKTI